jgi:hypothetical protein
MKSIYKVLAFTAMAAALATSCREVSEYQTTAFANLYRTTVSVDENVGTVTLPVMLSSIKGDNNTAVTFKVKEGSAKEGVNFTVEPAGKVLNFSDTDSLNITIKIIDQPGVFTGSLTFDIELESATNDYQIGGSNETNFTIKDNDHPLANLFGTFSGTIKGYWRGNLSASVQVLADPDNTDKVLVYNLDPYFAAYGYVAPKYNAYSGTVNADKNQISIKCGQAVGYDEVYLQSFNDPDPDAATGYADNIVLTFSSDYKAITIVNSFGPRDSGGWYEIYYGNATLTKN